MTEPLQLRFVDRAWARDLQAVNRACPIGADFTFRFERGADFFAWPALVYDEYRYAGLYRGEALRGYFMYGLYPGWDGRREGRCLYAGDARVLPTERGRRSTERAAVFVQRDLPEDVSVGFCLVKRGNAPAKRVVDSHRTDQWRSQPLCGFEAANVLLLGRVRPPRGPGTPQVRRAHRGDADLEAFARLYQDTVGRRPFAPRTTAADLEAAAARRPDQGLERHYLAERGGRLVGALVAWDMHAVHRIVVLRYPPLLSWGRRLWPLVRRLRPGTAPLPAPGEAFRSLTVTRLAVRDRDPRVLRALLAAVINDHAGQGYHMIHVGLASQDPLRRALRGLPCQRFRSDIAALVRAGSLVDREPERLQDPYLDLQFI